MTMREKMARAMADLRINHQKWDDMHPRLRDGYLVAADAALSALAEPTEVMVSAGTRAYDEGDGEYGIYRAMIAKAGD